MKKDRLHIYVILKDVKMTVPLNNKKFGYRLTYRQTADRDPALPPLKAISTAGHFPMESMYAHMHFMVFTVISFSLEDSWS